jgi:hypothetical protein
VQYVVDHLIAVSGVAYTNSEPEEIFYHKMIDDVSEAIMPSVTTAMFEAIVSSREV